MTSSEGISQYRPESQGRYILQQRLINGSPQQRLINERVVYANTESNLFFYSVTSEYEELDGAWAVSVFVY